MSADTRPRLAREYAACVAILAIVALLPAFVDSVYWSGVIIVSLYFAMMAFGWNLQIGFTGQTSLAPAAFAMIGAYTTALLGVYFSVSPVLGIIAGVLVSGTIGIGLGAIVLRLRGTYFALTTLAFAEVANSVIMNSYSITSGVNGMPVQPIFADRITWYYVFVGVAFAVNTALFVLLRSPAGLYLQAIRDDELAARAHGVRAVFWKISSFAVSSMICGLAGALYAHFAMLAHPSMGSLFETGLVMTIVIIGGIGSLVGPLLGALIIYPLTEALRDLGGYHGVFYALIVIIVARFFRQGLWGGAKLFWPAVRSLIHTGIRAR